MVRHIKALYVKRGSNGLLDVKYLTLIDRLSNYYAMLQCDTIDIIERNILGKRYAIIIDDCALLGDKVNSYPLAMCQNFEEMILGSIVICGVADYDGNLSSIDRKDVEQVKKAISMYINQKTQVTFEAIDYSIEMR